MMTQQYPVLKYTTYLIIFIFHIVGLLLLYNYSTKSLIDHLALSQGGIKQLHQTEETSLEEFEEPTVSVQQDFAKSLEVPQNKAKEEDTQTYYQNLTLPPQDTLITPSPQEPATKQHPILEQNSKHDAMYNQEHISTAHALRENPSISTNNNNDKLNIPPAAFFQAFKQSYYQEQALFEQTHSVKSKGNSTSGLHEESESLVTQRLGELKIADYVQQIKKAFQEAARRTPGMYLNSDKELKTDLDVQLEIQSQGAVKITKFQSSGILQIDEYIQKFLRDIIVSPIPKRYNIKALPFSTKILINIDKSTRFYTVRCFF